METFERNVSHESQEKYGRNVTLVIDLIRHPEKDYATGNLTEAGKQAFVQKLQEEYNDPSRSFDTVKGYVSPLKRGQQAAEPLSQFLKENNIETTIRTKQELLAHMDQYSAETDKAMDAMVKEKMDLDVSAEQPKTDALEPVSKDEETLKNEILIHEFFDKEFPAISLKGEDVGKELDDLIQHFAQMARRFHSGSKVKIIAVGHSGINEYLVKLIYLKNHPELKSADVGTEQVGGLLDYMSGPEISIISDTSGKQTATFKYKDLSLVYPLS
jgi:broad specificity phosphatase PhoE